MVELLLTLDASGHVAKAEALTGLDLLRKAAWMRSGTGPTVRYSTVWPVPAYTDASVSYTDWSKGQGAAMQSMPDMMEASRRLTELEEALPRTPPQKLADLEQDSLGGDKTRRFYALNQMMGCRSQSG